MQGFVPDRKGISAPRGARLAPARTRTDRRFSFSPGGLAQACPAWRSIRCFVPPLLPGWRSVGRLRCGWYGLCLALKSGAAGERPREAAAMSVWRWAAGVSVLAAATIWACGKGTDGEG